MNSVKWEISGSETVLALEPKEFKSGKVGFFAQGKAVVGNDKYQAQTILTKIEPKPQLKKK